MRFTGRSLVKQSNNWLARESWDVVGTPDPSIAIETAIGFNAAHIDNPNMRAGRRFVESRKGPLAWIVAAEFSFGDHGLCATSRLLEPYVILPDIGRYSFPSNVDENNNAILNSAGDPLDPMPLTAPTFGLCVRRYEPFFDVQKSLLFSDTCNSDSFTLAGAGPVAAGQCYCEYVKPFEPYTATAPEVGIEYRFEFRGGTNPFDLHPMDVGRWGWYSASGTPTKGQIVAPDGTQPDFDVPLDGTGKPIDSSYKILAKDGVTLSAPIANPNLPPGFTVESSYSTANQKTLLWRGKTRVAFAGIL